MMLMRLVVENVLSALRRVAVLTVALAVGAAACGLSENQQPEAAEPESSSPWYNTSGIKEIFGDFDPAAPLYVSNPQRIVELEQRGEYLAKNAAACGSCHMGAPGQTDGALSGGRLMRDSFGEVSAANITPDKETGIGNWNVGAVMRAMRASLDLRGRPLSIDLHRSYRWMSDEDAAAIAVYVLRQPAVTNKVDRRELGGFERNSWGLFPEHRDIDVILLVEWHDSPYQWVSKLRV